MAKLQRHVGVLNLKEVDQKAVDRLISGIVGEGIAKSSVNANLRKIKSAFKKAVEWYGYPIVKIKLLKEERRPLAVIPGEKVRQFLGELRSTPTSPKATWPKKPTA